MSNCSHSTYRSESVVSFPSGRSEIFVTTGGVLTILTAGVTNQSDHTKPSKTRTCDSHVSPFEVKEGSTVVSSLNAATIAESLNHLISVDWIVSPSGS